MHKPFEQELHDQYDAPAKEAIKQYLERNHGIAVDPNTDQYGVDLLITRDGKVIGYAEVEVRQWSPTCPYPTIHVPLRKEKYFNDRTLFFAITKDMKSAYWIQTLKIKEYPVKEISNYKIRSGELFFDVPTKEFQLVSLGD
jgi:hypothetical protein